MELSMAQRQAVTNRLATKYRQASRSERSLMLDQLVESLAARPPTPRAHARTAGGTSLGESRRLLPTERVRSPGAWRRRRDPGARRRMEQLLVVGGDAVSRPPFEGDGQGDGSEEGGRHLHVAAHPRAGDRRG